jgi:hypothetical protein
MTGNTPELFFSNLPEIEALPFDLSVSILEDQYDHDAARRVSGVEPHYAPIIHKAMAKTSRVFGVALEVRKAKAAR